MKELAGEEATGAAQLESVLPWLKLRECKPTIADTDRRQVPRGSEGRSLRDDHVTALSEGIDRCGVLELTGQSVPKRDGNIEAHLPDAGGQEALAVLELVGQGRMSSCAGPPAVVM